MSGPTHIHHPHSAGLFSKLAAPKHNKLGARQFFKSHRSSRMDAGRADADLRAESELIAII